MSEEKKSVRWYEGAYIVVLLALFALSMTYLRPHRVGLIDMDKAYHKLGIAERLKVVMQEKDRAARARFDAFNARMAPEEARLLDAFRTAQSDAQKAKAQADLQEFHAKLQAGRSEIATEVKRYERDALMTFRERVRPHVRKVAASRRCDLVLEPVNTFLVMNNAADLTDAVIKEAQKEFTPERDLIDPALLKASGLWIEGPQAGAPAPATP